MHKSPKSLANLIGISEVPQGSIPVNVNFSSLSHGHSGLCIVSRAPVNAFFPSSFFNERRTKPFIRFPKAVPPVYCNDSVSVAQLQTGF